MAFEFLGRSNWEFVEHSASLIVSHVQDNKVKIISDDG